MWSIARLTRSMYAIDVDARWRVRVRKIWQILCPTGEYPEPRSHLALAPPLSEHALLAHRTSVTRQECGDDDGQQGETQPPLTRFARRAAQTRDETDGRSRNAVLFRPGADALDKEVGWWPFIEHRRQSIGARLSPHTVAQSCKNAILHVNNSSPNPWSAMRGCVRNAPRGV